MSSKFFSYPLDDADIQELNCRGVEFSKAIKSLQITGAYIRDEVLISYFTGVNVSVGALWISCEGEKVLFVDGRYIAEATEAFSLHKGFCSVIEMKSGSFEKTFHEYISASFYHQTTTQIAFHGGFMVFDQVEELLGLSKYSQHRIEYISLPSLFKEVRRKKSLREIEAIKKACQLCERGFEYIIHLLKPGITEEQIARKLKCFWFEQGADSISFEPIIAFGKNSALPHWRASSTQLSVGDIVLIDIGVHLNQYHSDMTRTFSFGDPVSSEFDQWFDAVKEAYTRALSFSKAGVHPQEVDKSARESLTGSGYAEFFKHGLGHGVGLEIHEAPTVSQRVGSHLQQPLILGDVITIEPGIYFEGKGGVRLENTCLVQKDETLPLMAVPIYPRWKQYL